jgi:hypothetical protein
MKKFSLLASMLLLSATVTFLFIACQKEQQSVATTTASASGDANVIVAVSGSGIPGVVTQSYANQLRKEFLKTVGPNESQYIEFSIQDLTNYLKAMTTKYGSTKVYVNFGMYNANTAPDGFPDYAGRKTVFFSVNNKKSASTNGNIVLSGGDGGSGGDDDNSFNHGQIFP